MIRGAGRMGWGADTFWFSTPSFFYAAYYGHMEQERERVYSGYAQARLIAYYAYAPHLAQGSQLKLSDIVRLPGDDEIEAANIPEVSQEEIDSFNAAADRAYAQIHGKEWQQQPK